MRQLTGDERFSLYAVGAALGVPAVLFVAWKLVAGALSVLDLTVAGLGMLASGGALWFAAREGRQGRSARG
jgi:hypothetical protein